jgi:uncharacterized protein (TIGR02996 family)
MPPPRREPFLRAICENPDDDAPRLVYADWLDEHGDAERAEFIRLQIKLVARTASEEELIQDRQRCDELLRKHGWEWRGSQQLPLEVRVGEFHRGFVESIEFERPRSFFRFAPALHKSNPIAQVTISNMEDQSLRRALDSDLLSNVRQLALTDYRSQGGAIWRLLAEAPSLANLTTLTVSGRWNRRRAYGRALDIDPESARLISESPHLRKLETFSPTPGVCHSRSELVSRAALTESRKAATPNSPPRRGLIGWLFGRG